jgi:hypothetical protein
MKLLAYVSLLLALIALATSVLVRLNLTETIATVGHVGLMKITIALLLFGINFELLGLLSKKQ